VSLAREYSQLRFLIAKKRLKKPSLLFVDIFHSNGKTSFKFNEIAPPFRGVAYALLVEILASFTAYPGTLIDW
jgi:hypothetical protein